MPIAEILDNVQETFSENSTFCILEINTVTQNKKEFKILAFSVPGPEPQLKISDCDQEQFYNL